MGKWPEHSPKTCKRKTGETSMADSTGCLIEVGIEVAEKAMEALFRWRWEPRLGS